MQANASVPPIYIACRDGDLNELRKLIGEGVNPGLRDVVSTIFYFVGG